MNLEIFGARTSNGVSPLKDPFSKNSVKSAMIYVHKGSSGFTFSGHVEFQNGLTEGKQNFKAENMNGILAQMEAFLVTLK